MQQEHTGPGPYTSWPTEPHARWIRAGNTFGRHVIAALEYAKKNIPPGVSSEERAIAEKAAADVVRALMALFDGVTKSDIDPGHVAGYVLQMQVLRRGEPQPVEVFELAPVGDGLGMGFAGWVEGDFG